MANVLSKDKQIAVIGALAEGNSIRAIERMTGIYRNTIMKLGVRVGQGKTIWDGVVEVFDLHGHPKTHRIYAWAHDTDDPENPRRHVTVLHIPPAISPLMAVRTAITAEVRNAQA